MKKYLLLINALACAFLYPVSGKDIVKTNTYTNPVKTSDGKPILLADPFVYEHKGTYYMTGTTANGFDYEGFDYYTSKDLITWEFKGALFRKTKQHFGAGAFWAPEVKFYKGKFYMTYSCLDAQKGILLSCLAVSDTPNGPFQELYSPWFDLGYSAIDCHIFVDNDKNQTPYLYFSKNGNQDGYTYGEIYGVKLKPDLSGFEGEPQLISQASQSWEKVRYNVNRCNEGPFVIKKKNTYYMTYSANDTGYSNYGVGVSTASHPLGAWTKYEDNPLFTTDLDNEISSPGHNSIVMSPNGKEMFIIYHRHADAHGDRPSFDRVVCIDRIYIDKKGKLKIIGPTNTPQRIPR